MKKSILNWLYVLIFTIIIFGTIPYGPQIWKFIYLKLHIDRPTLVIICILITSLLFLLIIYRSINIFHIKKVTPYLVFLSVLIIYIYMFVTIHVPVEKIHLMEYGLLSVLVFRSISNNKIKHYKRYIVSFLICLFIGSLDEFIQYLHPTRFGELRDVMLNALASFLPLLVLFFLKRSPSKLSL